MDLERWARLYAIFDGAVEREGADREDFIRAACGGDQALYGELVSLLETAGAPSNGSAVPLAEDLTGRTIGQYRILEQIATGGMGILYKALHVDLGVHRALKVVAPACQDETAIARFRREAKHAAALRHSNIVPIHDFGCASGIHYLVMEFVEGENLYEKILREGPLRPLQQIVTSVDPIAAALDYAHEQGILHRDIKPANILMRSDGTVLLTDFGLSKPLSSDERLTKTGTVVGTLPYMSPEQLLGARELTGASDIYSLGVVLFELLTGKMAVDTSSPGAVVDAILNRPLRAPTSVCADFPRVVDDVVMKATAKDPARRYPSATALVRALRAALEPPENALGELAAPEDGTAGRRCPSCRRLNRLHVEVCVSCSRDLRDAAPTGLVSSRYRLLQTLGQGGMGVVYKARDEALQEIVVLKVLRPGGSESDNRLRRFMSEIRIARRVTHKNVCRIHDYTEDDGTHCISMEFVDGVDLKRWIARDGPLSPRRAYEIAIQLTEGLQAIHEEGIIHRDLKSANVMVDRTGTVRVLDFGIAKSWGVDLTTTGTVVGTLEYMSPEQLRDLDLDARSDVYGLGVILFEMFTGELPFTAATTAAVIYKHLHEEAPLDGSRAEAIPPPMRDVIRRCLAKEREQRFESARDVHEAIRAATRMEAAAGDETPPTKSMERLQNENARSRKLWTGVAGGVAILTAGMGYWATTFHGDETAPRPGGPSPVSSMEQACQHGDATACYELALKYRDGDGVEKDESRLVPLLETSCELGLGSGCDELLAQLEETCSTGNASACTQLGAIYNRGVGVTQDASLASSYYTRGCEGGDMAGCSHLGTIYEFGLLGGFVDRAQAEALYRRACSAEEWFGCGHLGVLYLEDAARREEALALLRDACAHDVPRACDKLREIGEGP